MATNKNAEFKLRQQEFRKLVKRKIPVPKGVKPNDYEIPIEEIKYKGIPSK